MVRGILGGVAEIPDAREVAGAVAGDEGKDVALGEIRQNRPEIPRMIVKDERRVRPRGNDTAVTDAGRVRIGEEPRQNDGKKGRRDDSDEPLSSGRIGGEQGAEDKTEKKRRPRKREVRGGRSAVVSPVEQNAAVEDRGETAGKRQASDGTPGDGMALAQTLQLVVRGSVPARLEDTFLELVGNLLGQTLARASLARGQRRLLLRRLRIVAPVERAVRAVAVEDRPDDSAPVVLAAPRLHVQLLPLGERPEHQRGVVAFDAPVPEPGQMKPKLVAKVLAFGFVWRILLVPSVIPFALLGLLGRFQC